MTSPASANLHIAPSANLHIATSANRHINTSANRHITTSANPRIVTLANRRIVTSANRHIVTSSHQLIIQSISPPSAPHPILLYKYSVRAYPTQFHFLFPVSLYHARALSGVVRLTTS